MQDLNLRELVVYVKAALIAALKHKWIGLGAAWFICLGGWLFVAKMPNVYEGKAKIAIDTRSALGPLLKGLTVQSDLMNEVILIRRTLLSRPNLEAIARETDLDVHATTPGMMEQLITSLEDRIRISATRDGGILDISFTASDRETARRVVNEILNLFVESSLNSERRDTDSSTETLQLQIKEYEKRLTTAERKLKEFKQEHVGKMPGDRGDYYSRLQQAMLAKQDIERNLNLTREKKREIDRLISGEAPTFGIASSVQTSSQSPYEARIAEIEAQIEQLRIGYTDKHPELVRLMELLEEYKQKRDELMMQSVGSPLPTFSPLDQNPVFQNMKIQQTNLDIEIAELKANRRAIQAEIEEFNELVDVIPEVEAQLNALNRDYAVVLGRYNAMLERWETLQTSQAIKESASEISFQTIEPPFVPTAPVGPNRILFGAVVLILGLAAGSIIPILLGQLSHVVVSEIQLKKLQLPVLGNVSYIGNGQVWLTASTAAYAIGVGLLLTTFGASVIYDEQIGVLVRG